MQTELSPGPEYLSLHENPTLKCLTPYERLIQQYVHFLVYTLHVIKEYITQG